MSKEKEDYILKNFSESLCFHNNRYFVLFLEVCKVRFRCVKQLSQSVLKGRDKAGIQKEINGILKLGCKIQIFPKCI